MYRIWVIYLLNTTKTILYYTYKFTYNVPTRINI